MAYTFKQCQILAHREAMYQMSHAEQNPTCLHVPCILGPPGVGKTALARGLADELEIPLVRINGGETADPVDIAGMLIPRKTQELDGVTTLHWGLNQALSLATREPVMLFVDDIDKMDNIAQGSLLSLIGERTVRQYRLHPHTILIAAGNRVGDDVLSNELSESLRTRLTLLELLPDLHEWCRWGLESGTITQEVVGFLQWQRTAFYGKKNDVLRFPTPRGWEEASADMKLYPDPYEDILGDRSNCNWKTIVSMRVGESTGNSFWSWFCIVKDVDVDAILTEGVISMKSGKANIDEGMMSYAAIYALTRHLDNVGLKPRHTGLARFIENLSAENRVALLVQLSKKTDSEFRKHFPKSRALIVSALSGVGPIATDET